MIQFHEVSLQNFMSFGDSVTTVKLDRSPSTLITGKNGHGKSAVFEALCFCLFNKSFRGINKPALINTTNQKGMSVSVSFSHGDALYAVTRGIKPAVFTIKKNGEALDEEAASKDQQVILEEVLGFGFPEFVKTIMLGHANFKPFMQLTTPERRQFVDAVLNLEVYTKMAKLHKENVADNLSKIRDVNTKVASDTQLRDQAQQALNVILQNSSDLVESAQAAYDLATSKVRDVSDLNAKISDLQSEHEKKSAALKSITSEINNLNARKMSAVSDIRRAESQIASADMSGKCPTCGGAISTEKVDEHVSALKLSVQTKQQEVETIKEQLEVIEPKIAVREADILPLTNQIHDIRREVSQQAEAVNAVAAAKRALDAAKLKASANTEPFEQQIEKSNAAIQTAGVALDVLNNTAKMYKVATELLKDTGIKAQMIGRFIPLLNSYVNKHLDSLGAGFRLEIDREFNDKIIGRYKDEFSYVSLSQGERCRVDLAMLFAWLQVATESSGVGSNLLVLDEIGASELDADGVDSMFTILDDVCHNKNVFIISHRDDIAQRCRSVIQIEKREGFSKIV